MIVLSAQEAKWMGFADISIFYGSRDRVDLKARHPSSFMRLSAAHRDLRHLTSPLHLETAVTISAGFLRTSTRSQTTLLDATKVHIIRTPRSRHKMQGYPGAELLVDRKEDFKNYLDKARDRAL